jgi:hypothetical protein
LRAGNQLGKFANIRAYIYPLGCIFLPIWLCSERFLPNSPGSFMIRAVALSFVLSCLSTASWAQAQPAPSLTQSVAPSTMAQTKKPPPKAKTAAKPSEPMATRPCRLGVIPVVGDTLGIKTIGLTVFGNEYAEASIESWGIDELVVARIRAAAGSDGGVRRIAYAKGAFASFDNPKPALFRNSDNDLTAIVRQIAGSSKLLSQS